MRPRLYPPGRRLLALFLALALCLSLAPLSALADDTIGTDNETVEGADDTNGESGGETGDETGDETGGETGDESGGDTTPTTPTTTVETTSVTETIGDFEYVLYTTVTKTGDKVTDTVRTATVKLYKGGDTAVEVPSLVKGSDDNTYKVTAVGDRSFSSKVALTRVILPESVTSIGEYAFTGSINLLVVTLWGTVTQIAANAFNGCSKLSRVYYLVGVEDMWQELIADMPNSPLASAKCVPVSMPFFEDTITFDYNYPTGAPTSEDITTALNGILYEEDWPTVNFTGYTFDGWYYYASNQTECVGTPYKGETKCVDNIEGATAQNPEDKNGNKTYVEKKDADGNNVMYNGYQVYTNKDGTAIKVHAHWKDAYTITFNLNASDAVWNDGITGAISLTSHGNLPDVSTPYRSGYTFLGWYTEDGTKVENAEDLAKAGLNEEEPAITLYAHWQGKYIVTFDLQSGTWPDGTKDEDGNFINNTHISLDFHSNGTLPDVGAEPTRSGYNFAGWYTTENDESNDEDDLSGALSAGSLLTGLFDDEDKLTVYAHWTKSYTVTFDANGGAYADGSATDIRKATEEHFSWPTDLIDPTREGYDFDGWYLVREPESEDAKIDTSTYKFDFTGTTSYTVYAHWKVTEYTITFDLDGGTWTDKDTEYFTLDETTGNYTAKTSTVDDVTRWTLTQLPSAPTPPTKDADGVSVYYLFDGWYQWDSESGTWATDASGNLIPLKVSNVHTGAATYKAKYIGKYTIVFDANGGIWGTETDEDGETVEITTKEVRTPYQQPDLTESPMSDLDEDPGRPTYAGYGFDTWYTDRDGGVKVTAGIIQFSDSFESITVYAHWKGAYTVTFHANGGYWNEQAVDGDGNPLVDEEGNPVMVTEKEVEFGPTFDTSKFPTSPMRTGTIETVDEEGNTTTEEVTYNFFDWYTADGTRVTENAALSEFDSDGNGKIDLYAHWTDQFKITFHPYGGAWTDAAEGEEPTATREITTGYDGKLPTIPTEPAREGYLFAGWYTAPKEMGGEPFEVTADTLFGEAMTLYADWVKEYTVTFDLNYGEGGEDGNIYAELTTGVDFTLSSLPKDPTRSGYTFAGWYLEDGEEPITTEKVYNGDTTVYAHWIADCVVILDANGGTFSDGETQKRVTVAYGQTYGEVVSSFTTPSRDGYTFGGWSLSAGGEQIISEYVFASEEPITIYVRWEEIVIPPYTITFDLNSEDARFIGTRVDTLETSNGYLPYLPTNIVRDGYTFSGWFADADTEDLRITEDHLFTGPTTIYAHWTKDTSGDETPGTSTETVYTIMLNANGGTLSGSGKVQTGTDGRLASLPSSPTRKNHTFDGWYTLPVGGVKITTSYQFQSDTTIYAQWTAVTVAKTYEIYIRDSANGVVSADYEEVTAGTTVTLQITPDTDYILSTLYVYDKNGSRISTTRQSSTRYTFTMPASWVDVEATFIATTSDGSGGSGIGGGSGVITDPSDVPSILAPGQIFADVPLDYWAAGEISWAYSLGYISGTGSGMFDPDSNATRQQMWRVLSRLMGNDFSSMEESNAWARTIGLSTGGETSSDFTRSEMAVALYRTAFLMKKDLSATSILTDYWDGASVRSNAVTAMKWAIHHGIIEGDSNGYLRPTGTVTRAQFVVMLYRYCVNVD